MDRESMIQVILSAYQSIDLTIEHLKKLTDEELKEEYEFILLNRESIRNY